MNIAALRVLQAQLWAKGVKPGTVEAHCRIDLGDVTVVPYTLLDPVD